MPPEEPEAVRDQPIAISNRATEGPPSAAHDLLCGLRCTRNEEQLTRALGNGCDLFRPPPHAIDGAANALDSLNAHTAIAPLG